MRWFLDTEFAENGETIKLISIALVNEDDSERYYRVLSDGWTPDDCDDWVKVNVLPQLNATTAARSEVAFDLEVLLLRGGKGPEIYGYFADYDWVVFCQLFGRMVDLPEGMPMYCRDLKQEMDRRNIKKYMLPVQLGTEHNALNDALWIRDAYVAMGRMP